MKAASLVPLQVMGPNLTCPALVNGLCSVYAVRPLICRLWGVVREMACPFGCKPERWLADREVKRMLREMQALNKGAVDGPELRGRRSKANPAYIKLRVIP